MVGLGVWDYVKNLPKNMKNDAIRQRNLVVKYFKNW